MSMAVSFLSGKGGTGKTTLVLSIADLLSRCGINTLIVDCDLSTNGATFFYESFLQKGKEIDGRKAYSLSEIFNRFLNTNSMDVQPLNIHTGLDFLPSIPEISDKIGYPQHLFLDAELVQDLFYSLVFWAKQEYEVVLFDCQAGYTELLTSLLPRMDVNLFVLEADSISASSMRNLYLKIGNSIGNAKVYQVFNKASREEFEIYSKITGTFFVNIGTLLFDWKIRQAFSRAQVPELEKTSKKYGSDLCEICQVIFTEREISEKIKDFSLYYQYLKEIETRDKLENTLFHISKKEDEVILRRNRNIVIFVYLVCMILFGSLFLIKRLYSYNTSYESSILFLGAVFLVSIITVFSLAISLLKSSNSDKRDYQKGVEKELRQINERINKLEKNSVIQKYNKKS